MVAETVVATLLSLVVLSVALEASRFLEVRTTCTLDAAKVVVTMILEVLRQEVVEEAMTTLVAVVLLLVSRRTTTGRAVSVTLVHVDRRLVSRVKVSRHNKHLRSSNSRIIARAARLRSSNTRSPNNNTPDRNRRTLSKLHHSSMDSEFLDSSHRRSIISSLRSIKAAMRKDRLLRGRRFSGRELAIKLTTSFNLLSYFLYLMLLATTEARVN